MHVCADCGATYGDKGVDCAARFAALLALDHSRREPWGSRHGLAFSAYVLQHPKHHVRPVLERAWLMLYAVFVTGRDPSDVARALGRSGKVTPNWGAPPLPAEGPRGAFTVTIADLGAFQEASYPALLNQWCRAALAGWAVPPAS